ncbi:MAG: transposase [Candidatus Dormibacteraeota bacterium]|nr:transposase [Candidatus Dormibacteraeota bacterium]
MEDQIKDAKDCGLGNFPCHRLQANQVWLFLVQLAQNLLCWAKRTCLGPDFLLARPKRLRYQLLQVAGRLVHTGRRSILRLDVRWPWARELELAFTRLRSLPLSP